MFSQELLYHIRTHLKIHVNFVTVHLSQMKTMGKPCCFQFTCRGRERGREGGSQGNCSVQEGNLCVHPFYWKGVDFTWLLDKGGSTEQPVQVQQIYNIVNTGRLLHRNSLVLCFLAPPSLHPSFIILYNVFPLASLVISLCKRL